MTTMIAPVTAKAAPPQAAAPPPAVQMSGIVKRFGPVTANDRVDLTVAPGTLHAIVGENGAGKSTLMSVLYGFHQPDDGTIRIHGKDSTLRAPSDAIAAGIGMVHQNFMLIEPFTVLENIVLGRETGWRLRRGLNAERDAVMQLAADLGLEIDPNAVAGALPVGRRQRVEILKALYRGADILILDEPTSVLTPLETSLLFQLLGRLRAQGKTILLITHKLREVMSVADRVTVMRGGRVVADLAAAETTREQLAELMIGRKVALHQIKPPSHPGRPVLEVDRLVVVDAVGARRVKGVSLVVRAGEILGIAGVSGNGQSELLAALSGMVRPAAGRIRIDGLPAPIGDPAAIRRLGVAHVPEDQRRDGLVPGFAAHDCTLLGHHNDPRFAGRVMIRRRAVVETCARQMLDYDIRPADPEARIENLSGGNQQKLVLARELERDPALLLVGQPTRGVDIGAIELIHRRLLDLRDRGGAILLISAELDEIIALSDRILVMADGRFTGELNPSDATEQRLGSLMAGLPEPAGQF